MIEKDEMERFKSINGMDVYFMKGKEENGIKMMKRERKEGIKKREMEERKK